MTELTVFLLLVCKHAIADLALQSRLTTVKHGTKTDLKTPRLWIHCGDHAVLSFIVLIFFTTWQWAVILALLDFVIHGLIDYTKNRIQLRTGVTLNSKQYWYYAAVDQICHYLTYCLMVIILVPSVY